MQGRVMTDDKGTRRAYEAPALDKGLEIVELLAGRSEALGMAEIATALGRSRNEIYRMLMVLERRGYLQRRNDDRFELSNRLFSLAMSAPPLRNLHDAALPVMHRLADTLFQSCHLAVRSGHEIVIVARVESPDLLGFAVRVGYRRPAMLSTSGRVLFASLDREQQDDWLAEMVAEGSWSQEETDGFLADCRRIGAKGYHMGPSVFVDAITDLGVAIVDGASEGAVAALTLPFVSGRSARSTMDDALAAVRKGGDAISDTLRHG